MIQELIKNKKMQFLLILLPIAFIIICYYYTSGNADSYNTTILALNYSYGFISRGFIGTVYLLLDKITPFSMYQPRMAELFLLGCTAVFFGICFCFSALILRRCQRKSVAQAEYFLFFMCIWITSTFSYEGNFGRVDLFLIAISLTGVMLILTKRGEWLLIPLAAMAVMIHQGYVFMYFNMLLALLAYRFLDSTEKKQKVRYGVILVLSFVIASALFLYLELYSHSTNGGAIFSSVAENAKNLSYNGEYHKTLLEHEILGVDLAEAEHDYHMKNLCEILVFALFGSPYLVCFFQFARRLLSKAEGALEKAKYLVIWIGSLTMLPDFLLKVDYGRWVLSVLLYYFVMFLCMMAEDRVFAEEFYAFCEEKKQKPYWKFMLVFPIVMAPFLDVNIDGILGIIGHVLNREWLHWWPFLG